MSQAKAFTLHPGWSLILRDAGIRPDHVLRRAGLPGDMLSRENSTLTTDGYYRLWRGLEAEADDPMLPLRIGKALSVEAFDPPIFAALCSPDLNTAVRRIRRFKRLIGPIKLRIVESPASTAFDIVFPGRPEEVPTSLIAVELIFFVQIARLATRVQLRPTRVRAMRRLEPADAYTAYFGVPVDSGDVTTLTFDGADARRPFLTANDAMWRFFEPELRKRLSELDAASTTAERVRSALLELLPSGRTSIDDVALTLGLSRRTLQRRLKDEATSFQHVLNATREHLARYYLGHSALSGAEISFLLGFEDPNSFFRAFHHWTGQTPELARAQLTTSA